MQEMNCEIIRDLLPLYADEVISEESRALVEAHLQGCASCSRELAVMKKAMVLPVNQKLQQEEAETLGNLKKKLRRRTTALALLSAVLMVGVFLALFFWNAESRVCVPVKEAGVTVKNVGGVLLAEADHPGQVIVREITYTEDGSRRTAVVFYVYETQWQRLCTALRLTRKQTEPEHIYLGQENYVQEVYYGEFQDHKLLSDTQECLKEMKQMWKGQY